jgi:hypothetical protein
MGIVSGKKAEHRVRRCAPGGLNGRAICRICACARIGGTTFTRSRGRDSMFAAAASEPASSPASRLLQWDCVHPAGSRSIKRACMPVGWRAFRGIAFDRAGLRASGMACIPRDCIRSSGVACQWDGVHSAGLHSIERACIEFVGAGLLAKAACQAMTMSDGPTSSRASALLQWNGVHPLGSHSIGRGYTTFVGAGLLAKAVCQARTMSGGSTSSRASALLQWLCEHSDRVAAFACSGTQTKSGHKKTPCHRVGRRSMRATYQPNSQ